jgi:hypothetical protein
MTEISKRLDAKGRARDMRGATQLISQLEKELARIELFLSSFAQREEVKA